MRSEFIMTRPGVVASLLACLSIPAQAGTINGTVSVGKQAIAGAMVSLSTADALRSETVFSDAKGRYKLETALAGKLRLRVRVPYYRDDTRTLALGAKQSKSVSVLLKPMTSDREVSDSQPGGVHFASLPFPEQGPFTRERFQTECASCHQLGSPLTRRPRSAEDWMPTLVRMHAKSANFDQALMQARAEFLAAGFNGQPVTTRVPFAPAPELAQARFSSYALPDAVMPHDPAIHTELNKVFTVDQEADTMHVTDLATGVTKSFRAPAGGMPPGGKFTLLKIDNTGRTAARGLHSLALARDGNFYTTDSFAGGLSVFNPRTNAWIDSINIPGKTLYTHTIRADRDGSNLWFTATFSEQVGRLNVATHKVDMVDLPPAKFVNMPRGTIPYGIDVNPLDGGVWIARLNANKIGHVDPSTLAYTEYDSPVRAPRRLRFDAAGNLWVAGFGEGKIAKIRVSDFTSKVYTMPEIVPGQPAAPYNVTVHPKTQEVWINEIHADQLVRFLPGEERFIAYPLPLRGSYTRDFTFTAEGHVCTTTSPQPLGMAVIEGGVAQLVCLDTGG